MQLDVYFHEQYIGNLEYAQGKYSFAYTKEYIHAEGPPLSVRLPLTTQIFNTKLVRPFFANILPEGNIRRLLAKYENISETNDFNLLAKVGRECAGAVSLSLPGQYAKDKPGYTLLTAEELSAIFTTREQDPLLVRYRGNRLSLAGAQDKLPIYKKGRNLYLPEGNAPSSHIFKPAADHFPGLCFNEAFCAELARAVGLVVPAVEIISNGSRYAYLIERYDRQIVAGAVQRIHQEDFCQALSVLPENKYQAEGGPTLKDCFSVIDAYSVLPLIDRNRLLELICFNYLIGNADAHAKNISLLHTNEGVRLAPFYDLVCTLTYSKLSRKAAMKIGGEYQLNNIRAHHWEQLALESELKPAYVMSTLNELKEKVLSKLEIVAKRYLQYADPVIPEIVTLIKARCLK